MKINIAKSVDGEYVINDKIIENKIFDEELVDYRFVEREDTIDNLISWIHEANLIQNSNDTFLMKEDLKQLMGLNEKYVLSNINTNEFLSQEEDEEIFTEVCLDILKVNGKNPRRTNDLQTPRQP